MKTSPQEKLKHLLVFRIQNIFVTYALSDIIKSVISKLCVRDSINEKEKSTRRKNLV